MEKEVIFGWETIIDLYECDIDKISSAEDIQRYAKELCVVIDMIPYGEPQTPYFGEKCVHTKGYSLLQFVETSSITGHFSEGTNAAYINIFSCKPYDEVAAIDFTKEFFRAKKVVTNFIERK